MKEIRKCLIFGDSISTSNFSGGGYEVLLPKVLPVQKIVNFAENAAALTAGYPYSVCDTVLSHTPEEETDLVILWAGTNDWYYGAPAGDFTSHDKGCSCGALRQAALHLSKTYPSAVILTMTPLYRYSEYDGTEAPCHAFETKNTAGLTLYDYHTRLLQTADLVGLPVCDMHALSGINAANHTLYLRDGTHPSRAGYEKITRILSGFASRLLP